MGPTHFTRAMRATRRFRGVVLLSALLAGLAVLVERPLLLAGTAGLAAWLIAHQYRFFRALDRLTGTTEIDQSIPRDRVTTGETTAFSLSVVREPGPLALSVTAEPPVAATVEGESRSVALDPDQREARLALSLSWPVAGRFACDPATVVAADSLGLFTETRSLGSAPALTVEPRRPRNVHVGEGGEAVAAAFGEHEGGRLGTGFDPAEVRKYVAGDDASRIDWRATARLAEPHVREFESETDRRSVLLIDHRATTGQGPDGATKLDYLRHVALAFVGSARQLSDPLGCFAVGDAGLTARHSPAATDRSYARIRATVEDLRPTAPEGQPSDATTRRTGIDTARSPAAARRMADALDGDAAFDRTLRPYVGATDSYVRRIDDDPLFEVARREVGRLDGAVWTVILTDDSRPERLREAITVARRGGNRVLVFLAPSVLFESGGLADLEAAYDRYVDFEELRRDLAGLPGVSAFEVGPGDRLDAVLATGRERRENRRMGRA
jgi:uncharacterized protein (DUF58 family)